MPSAATPMAFVHAVLLGLRRYGADPGPAMREAQISPSLLQQAAARVTAAQFETLCRVAMQQIDDEALGWFSRRLPWGSYGMLCRASLGSPDLGVALKRWCRHHRLLTEDILLELEVGEGIATLRIREMRPLEALREFCLLSCMRYVHGYACWLVDSRIPLLQTCFPLRRPAHAAVHGLLFPGEVLYGCAQACMRFDAQYLALAPRRDEASLRSMLQHALPLTVRPYRRDRLLGERARALLAAQPGQPFDAPRLATALHVSVRTLHRHLAEEGTSLQRIKDVVRREHAVAQLRRGQESVKKIALSVGFANEKAFARAFRNWTGQSPSDYRGRRNSTTKPSRPTTAPTSA